MEAIGLNPIRLGRIGLDPIRINAIKLGVPGASGSDRPYIDPEVLASLKAVCICYGKSNDDPDRAIVKNLVDPDNPFVISNAAFKLNSGFGKYSADFESFDWAVNISQKQHNKATISLNGRLCNHAAIEVDEMKVNIIGNVTELIYWYIANPDDTTRSEIRLTSGINTLPKSYAKDDGQTYNIGFAYISGDSEITIEQIPSFEGAFVTDGIDDLITSTKTVQEMLGGSNEITVVSMIHQIDGNVNYTNGYTNYIRHGGGFIRNSVAGINGKGFNKTGIYGYTSTQLDSSNMGLGNVINNILGDKDDYSFERSSTYTLDDAKYSVQNFVNANNQPSNEGSSVAWYWTIIANKILTTDEINQVIAYYNLDRTLNPDILCNTIKQGITNENHAEFGDKLIDFSGNGRDIQLNNIAWKGDSGIGKYEVDFLDSSIWNSSNSTITSSKIDCKNAISHIMLLYYSVGSKEYPDIPSFKVIKTGADIDYSYIDETGSPKSVKIVDGVNILPASHNTLYSGSGRFCGFGNPGMGNSVTITQIPSHAGGLCLDGINDFGKVTGMPVYKDYTVVTDREIFANIGAISSKNNPGAFVETAGNSVYSFGQATSGLNFISTRSISYLSKYSYCGQSITAGAAEDGTDMWLGTIRDNDSRFFNGVIYSLMSFPYSMSEFLIERQLKKHKLGTLYPNMVEFRPVIKANANYKITYYQIDSTNTWKSIKVGDYIVIGAKLAFQITFDNDASELKEVVSPQLSGIIVEKRPSNPGYNIYSYITSKSPQKINITIDEYIRFEDIVQPYPVLLRFNDENGNEVSWGGKFRVGSTITRIGNFYENNLLDGLYVVRNPKLNGNNLITPTHVVEKSMVFTCDTEYLLDNNEPKCILSPRLLRIPNSSYKILGYIPDISGNGNHGILHNSAYIEGSGVNEDGSYQFDGVDDFVTIPTLSSGGKQVLMKVNWRGVDDGVIYDQRNGTTAGVSNQLCFSLYPDSIAYQFRNVGGKTFIDGILNNNIVTQNLKGITHNITSITNYDINNSSTPFIGANAYSNKSYVPIALYDFMLFDNISTDDKIKELNEYVGIEAKVELPPYYWDTYGKTNLDEDKATIQQRGIAEGDYDLTNYNHAYDKMSGYGGYSLGRFDKSWAGSSSNNTSVVVVLRNPYDITLKKLGGNSDWEFNNTELKVISNPVSVKFKSNKNIRFTCDYHYYPVGENSEGTPLGITFKDLIANEDAIITISPISQENIDKYNIDVNRGYYLVYFQLSSTLAVNEEVTIEMLPLYPNGLVYDGVTDYSENANIPALTDYTYIFKRELLDASANTCSMYKGILTEGSKTAFVSDYDKNTEIGGRSFGNYIAVSSLRTNKIIYGTKASVNGDNIVPGNNVDALGLVLGKYYDSSYKKLVFYKLILYPKTIPLLQINFLKNLMERDEIIDLNNPIFIQE